MLLFSQYGRGVAWILAGVLLFVFGGWTGKKTARSRCRKRRMRLKMQSFLFVWTFPLLFCEISFGMTLSIPVRQTIRRPLVWPAMCFEHINACFCFLRDINPEPVSVKPLDISATLLGGIIKSKLSWIPPTTHRFWTATNFRRSCKLKNINSDDKD